MTSKQDWLYILQVQNSSFDFQPWRMSFSAFLRLLKYKENISQISREFYHPPPRNYLNVSLTTIQALLTIVPKPLVKASNPSSCPPGSEPAQWWCPASRSRSCPPTVAARRPPRETVPQTLMQLKHLAH